MTDLRPFHTRRSGLLRVLTYAFVAGLAFFATRSVGWTIATVAWFIVVDVGSERYRTRRR